MITHRNLRYETTSRVLVESERRSLPSEELQHLENIWPPHDEKMRMYLEQVMRIIWRWECPPSRPSSIWDSGGEVQHWRCGRQAPTATSSWRRCLVHRLCWSLGLRRGLWWWSKRVGIRQTGFLVLFVHAQNNPTYNKKAFSSPSIQCSSTDRESRLNLAAAYYGVQD